MKKIILGISVISMMFACNSKPAGTNEEINQEVVEGAASSNEAGVFFRSPEEGATVTSPVKVEMGVEGMTVEPAGELHEGKGHHHIVIDGGAIPKGTVVPADSLNIHFGKGQTETTLDLSPGKHTLTLQFADGLHQSYGEEWSKTIEITVE
ncbi:MAG: DUF4399 domain-containing protein [Cyclobacteriaceae bacterium]|nr:DUF4399 domain-containing protein [Cyclobacteriaceae bacterium]